MLPSSWTNTLSRGCRHLLYQTGQSSDSIQCWGRHSSQAEEARMWVLNNYTAHFDLFQERYQLRVPWLRANEFQQSGRDNKHKIPVCHRWQQGLWKESKSPFLDIMGQWDSKLEDKESSISVMITDIFFSFLLSFLTTWVTPLIPLSHIILYLHFPSYLTAIHSWAWRLWRGSILLIIYPAPLTHDSCCADSFIVLLAPLFGDSCYMPLYYISWTSCSGTI